ncbi:hypothetical protein P154DRAFT_576771 [Amniculicola lignicola CBS 123094]|uniref:Uncharacterized protein n=1 Tax=Amniculicola lignicola CBS 123094 TaxID=1392246 RepID=A0A6A5WCM8_9PLEO|nr:hypothetical protein P154DRAFT_576771 [Amniculicola lignicola CBS 123094]
MSIGANATSNSTLDHGNFVGWVSEPDQRGTVSLIFSCVCTVIICTWNALHLNVPERRKSNSKWLLFFRKLGYLAVALLGPEMIAYLAIVEWNHAREVSKDMKAYKRNGTWSDTLSFFVLMGGVEVRRADGTTLFLPPDKAQEFYDNGWLSIADLPENAVEDKSKANWFNKGIAFIQISYFFAQMIGRADQGLSITALELFTLAYVLCAILAYAFWWDKPFDVQVPLTVNATAEFTEEIQKDMKEWSAYKRFFDGQADSLGVTDDADNKRYGIFFVCCCALFGACHLIGWNAHFPTPIERILWRAGSISCCVFPIVLFLATFDSLKDRIQDTTVGEWVGYIVVGTCLALYVIVRVYLMFEAFFALRSVAGDVYDGVQWSNYIPHV